MKRFGTTAVIAALLLASALFYRFRDDTPAKRADPAAPAATATAASAPSPPSPTMHAAHEGVLTLRADSSHGYMLSGQPQEVYAAIDINAQEGVGGERPPLNISLVIDRSGSMRGDKMTSARQASKALIDQLRPQDRLSIISYGTDVTLALPSTLATGAARSRMRAVVEKMRAAGGTNISGGYARGVDEVVKFMRDDTINRVILVSDGEATVGNTSAHVFRQMARDYRSQGVSLSTIGVGLDYNEDVMASMADEGAGNYYFVDTPASAVAIFEAEMEQLAATVAKNTALLIAFGEGVTLQNIYGFSHHKVGDKVAVSLAEFRDGDNKNILLKLRVDPARDGLFSLLEATLSYEDVQRDVLQTQRVALESVRTEDVALAKSRLNVEVIGRVQQIEVATSLEEAMVAFAEGRDEDARGVLRRSQRKVSAARDKYKFKSAAIGRAGAELEATLDAVSEPAVSTDERKRVVKRQKSVSRRIQKSDVVDLW